MPIIHIYSKCYWHKESFNSIFNSIQSTIKIRMVIGCFEIKYRTKRTSRERDENIVSLSL